MIWLGHVTCSRIQERARSTKEKLQMHSQERPTKIGTHLGKAAALNRQE